MKTGDDFYECVEFGMLSENKMIVLFETLLVNNTHTFLLLLRVGIFNKPEEK